MLPPTLAAPTVTYKLFVSGKSGVGKTALVAALAGTPVPPVHHETLGTSLRGGDTRSQHPQCHLGVTISSCVPPLLPPSPGIEATTVYWPAKPRASGRPVIFQLHFWDCGDGALKKFEHLLPVSHGEGGTQVSGGHTHSGPPPVMVAVPSSLPPRLVRKKRTPSSSSSPSPTARPSRSCRLT